MQDEQKMEFLSPYTRLVFLVRDFTFCVFFFTSFKSVSDTGEGEFVGEFFNVEMFSLEDVGSQTCSNKLYSLFANLIHVR